MFKYFKNIESIDEINSMHSQRYNSGSIEEEHLETDIIDDEEDLESNNMKINQINILTSQASVSQPL